MYSGTLLCLSHHFYKKTNYLVSILFFFYFLENLSPADLKKLKNKERKAKKKAEMEQQVILI